MQSFDGKVAVITGAASGIGRSMAERCVQEGMRVVLADVEEVALARAEHELRETGAQVLAVRTDVAQASDIAALAEQTLQAFGGVHLLCNNAGISAGGSAWESTLNDWEWTIGVNLWGVIHGLRTFIPIMLAQDTEAHIVNTASIAGLIRYGTPVPYQITKHAVVGLSEHLYYSLKEQQARIGVSVLCPGWVNTQILDSERNRPAELQNEPIDAPPGPELDTINQEYRRLVAMGMPPQQVADSVFKAIRAQQLYILTHPEFTPLIQQRMEDILRQQNPAPGQNIR